MVALAQYKALEHFLNQNDYHQNHIDRNSHRQKKSLMIFHHEG